MIQLPYSTSTHFRCQKYMANSATKRHYHGHPRYPLTLGNFICHCNPSLPVIIISSGNMGVNHLHFDTPKKQWKIPAHFGAGKNNKSSNGPFVCISSHDSKNQGICAKVIPPYNREILIGISTLRPLNRYIIGI